MKPGPESLPAASSDDVITLARNHGEGAALYHQQRADFVGLIGQARVREALELERIERARKAIDRKK